MKVYVSLPITGREKDDYTAHCERAIERLERLGYEPVSFLENGLPTEAPVPEHMRADYRLLLGCDAIYLCEGWEYSHGCMNELQVAADCRMSVLTHKMSDIDLFEKKQEWDKAVDEEIERKPERLKERMEASDEQGKDI